MLFLLTSSTAQIDLLYQLCTPHRLAYPLTLTPACVCVSCIFWLVCWVDLNRSQARQWQRHEPCPALRSQQWLDQNAVALDQLCPWVRPVFLRCCRGTGVERAVHVAYSKSLSPFRLVSHRGWVSLQNKARLSRLVPLRLRKNVWRRSRRPCVLT